ncbi:MAG: type II toxin-antitoxin system PemK/MazF family toxin [bacterium]
MEKDFDSWNSIKQDIEKNKKSLYANQREVWWCSIGINVGSESCGKNELFERPVLILKVIQKELLLVVPLSTKDKDSKYHIDISFSDTKSFAQLEHIKTISSKRLSRKVGRIPKPMFEKVWLLYKELL